MRALLPVLAACGGGEAQGGLSASSFAPDPALALQHADAEAPETGPTRWLVVEGSTWEIRDDLDGPAIEALEVATAGDLTVAGEVVLPASVADGASAGEATVSAVAPYEGWYGIFDPAVSVEVASGRAAGTWAFAQGFGPVRYTLDGKGWELVYYEARTP
jgi:hypothetical protein